MLTDDFAQKMVFFLSVSKNDMKSRTRNWHKGLPPPPFTQANTEDCEVIPSRVSVTWEALSPSPSSFHPFFSLWSNCSRRTRAETLATQWDCVFLYLVFIKIPARERGYFVLWTNLFYIQHLRLFNGSSQKQWKHDSHTIPKLKLSSSFSFCRF